MLKFFVVVLLLLHCIVLGVCIITALWDCEQIQQKKTYAYDKCILFLVTYLQVCIMYRSNCE